MSIQTDDNADTGMSDNDAVAQLMAGMKGPQGAPPADAEDDDQDEGEEPQVDDEGADEGEEPPANEEEEAEEPKDEDEDDEGEEPKDDEEEEEQAAPPAAPAPVTDDAVVKVVVDGQETEFTVGNLKRLAGQEASLTRKSQEADTVGGRAAIVLQGALEAVIEDLDPYKDVDWVLAGHQMEAEEFEWHRTNYTRLQARYDKLVSAAREFDGTVTARKQSQDAERAAEAQRILADPTSGIAGWNDEVDASVRQYGVSQGLDEADVKRIADASVLKVLHKAMQYDKLQAENAKRKEVAVEKIKTAPKGVKKGGAREALVPDAKRQQQLRNKLASGRATDDDAIALLTGRWGVKAR